MIVSFSPDNDTSAKLLARALVGETSFFGEVVGDRFHVVVGDVFTDRRRNGQSFAMQDLVFGSPLEGVRLFNVMGGFVEPGTPRSPEREPQWLPKATNGASGDGGAIPYPPILTGPLHIEVELAVVVRDRLCRASVSEAREAIFGWSVLNDVTAPEYGEAGLWAVGKAMDGFASWGPWIREDLSEEQVLAGLAISSTVNGQVVQSGTTELFCFSPSEILSHISHRITLYPGDVVSLGTPPPAAPVVVGDQVTCMVEKVGALHNRITNAESHPALRRS